MNVLFWTKLKLSLSVAFTLFTLLICGFLVFFAYVFHLRQNQFGFKNRRGALTLSTVAFSVLYMAVRVLAVWLAYFGVLRGLDGDDGFGSTAVLLVAAFDTLNSLALFGFGLSAVLRFWLLFYDVNLAIRSGDQKWMDLISKHVVVIDDLRAMSFTRQASSLFSRIARSMTNRSMRTPMSTSPKAGSARSPSTGRSPRTLTRKSTTQRFRLLGFTDGTIRALSDKQQNEMITPMPSIVEDQTEAKAKDSATLSLPRTMATSPKLGTGLGADLKAAHSMHTDTQSADDALLRCIDIRAAKASSVPLTFTAAKSQKSAVPIASFSKSDGSELLSSMHSADARTHSVRFGEDIVAGVDMDTIEEDVIEEISIVSEKKTANGEELVKSEEKAKNFNFGKGTKGKGQMSAVPVADDWYYDNKQRHGSMLWMLRRRVVPLLAVLMCAAVALCLSGVRALIGVLYALFLTAMFCAIVSIYRRFPVFHDHLRIFNELTMVATFGALSTVLYLVFVSLLFSGQCKDGQFWFELSRSLFILAAVGTLCVVQTHWVLHQFQSANALLNNADIYMPILPMQSVGFSSVTYATLGTDKDNNGSAQRGLCYYFLCCVDYTVSRVQTTGRLVKDTEITVRMANVMSAISLPFGADDEDEDEKEEEKDKGKEVDNVSAAILRLQSEDFGKKRSEPLAVGFGTVAPTLSMVFNSPANSLRTPPQTLRKTSRGRSKSVNSTKRLRRVLENEVAFRPFISHLFREFSYENLLAVIEMGQFSKWMLMEEGLMDESGAWTVDISQPVEMTLTSAVVDLSSTDNILLQFPAYVRNVRSSIVYHLDLSAEQKLIALCDKYVSTAAELSVNIDYRTRKKLTDLATHLRKGYEQELDHTVFHACTTQLLRLMGDSFSRFQRTAVYQKLIDEYPTLFDSI